MTQAGSSRSKGEEWGNSDGLTPIAAGWPHDDEAGQKFPVRLHSSRLPRRIAKKLKRTAKDCGFFLKLVQSHNVTARLFGYGSWVELLRDVDDVNGESDLRDVLDEDAVERRYAPRLASILEIRPDQALAMFHGVRRLLLMVHTPLDAGAHAGVPPIIPAEHAPCGPVVVIKKSKLKLPDGGKRFFDLS